MLASKLFSSAGIYLAANILNASVPFLLLPILTRILTPSDYGIIAMYGILASVLGAFTGLSINGAVAVRYFQLDSRRMASYVGACIGILSLSTLSVLIAIFFSADRLTSLTQIPGEWIYTAVIISSAQFVISIRLTLWQVKQNAIHYGMMQVSQGIINALLSLLFIFMLNLAWQGRLLGQIIATLIAMAFSLYWLMANKEIAAPIKMHQDSIDALKFGIPLIPHTIGGLLIATIDRFMVANLLDLKQAGVYLVAVQLGQAIGLLTESFNKSYAPWLMEKLTKPNYARDVKIVWSTYLYFLIVTILAFLLHILAPWILIIVGQEFRDAGEFLIYIAMGYAFGGMYYMVTNYIFFTGKTSYLAVMTLFSGICNVSLSYILIKSEGLAGAAQAFMLSHALLFLGTWLIANKVHPMPWGQAIFGFLKSDVGLTSRRLK